MYFHFRPNLLMTSFNDQLEKKTMISVVNSLEDIITDSDCGKELKENLITLACQGQNSCSGLAKFSVTLAEKNCGL